ncbi:MAG: hypothetical protein M3313_11735 [Actinomycetota bacterium]|nr:hypothetical protein [Actinomycetota bacterium]
MSSNPVSGADGIRQPPLPQMYGKVLIGEVRRAGWERLARGVHVVASEPSTPGRQAHAWRCLLGENVTFTGLTAAALRGWWLPVLPEDTPAL